MRKRSPSELRRTRGSWLTKKSERRGTKSVRRWPARPRPGLASSSNTIFLRLIKVAWSEISLKASDRLHDRRQFKSEIYQGALSIGSRGGARRENQPRDLEISRGPIQRA